MKLSLLQSLEEVQSPAKAQMLLPVADGLADGALTSADEDSQTFVSLVLGSLDAAAADLCNDRNGKAWEVYQKVLRHFFRSGKFCYSFLFLYGAESL